KGVLLGDKAAGDLPLLADTPDGLEAAILDARDLLVAEAAPDERLGCRDRGDRATKLRAAQQHRPERIAQRQYLLLGGVPVGALIHQQQDTGGKCRERAASVARQLHGFGVGIGWQPDAALWQVGV